MGTGNDKPVADSDSESRENSGAIVGNELNNTEPSIDNESSIQPDAHGAIDPAGSIKRGRGRPRKSDTASGSSKNRPDYAGTISGGTGKSKTNQKLGVDDLANKIFGGHQILALLTKQPALCINEKEAVSLAKAVTDLAKFHSLDIDPKYLAYGSFIFTVGMIYTPRVRYIAKSAQEKRAKNPPPSPASQPAPETAPVFTGQQAPIVWQ